MSGFRFIVIAGMVLGTGQILAQPGGLVLPGSSAESAQKLNNPLANYGNDHHEAAAAAFHAALMAERQHNRPRALRLMLLSLQRDPTIDKAFYDMGILCAQDDRWDDAAGFQREALKQAPPDSEVAKAAASELVRLEAIAPLVATVEGRKLRDYDIRLVRIAANKDPVKVAQDGRADLTGKDPDRWEGWALVGLMDAEAGEFQKSCDELKKAAELAPPARKVALSNAAEIAASEVKFKDLLDKANGFKGDIWEKQQYREAAAAFADAWNVSKASPNHWKIGLDAATAYMLDDDVPNAANILRDVRLYVPAEFDARIANMLSELAKIPDGVKAGADRPAGDKKPPLDEAKVRIRAEVGSLVTPQMELISRAHPLLLDIATVVVSVPDEEINPGKLEIGYKSSESLYKLYQNSEAREPAVPGLETAANQPVSIPASEAPAAAPGSTTPAPSFAHPAAETLTPPSNLPPSANGDGKIASAPTHTPPPSAARGPGVPLHVESKPDGARIVFDSDTNSACVSPCDVTLAPGRHTLVARKEGYRDRLKILNELPKTQSEMIELDAMMGTIIVESVPSGLALLIDGKEIGRVTPATLTLPAGKHRIAVVGGDGDNDVTIIDEGFSKIQLRGK